jgi:hypothetical protein
LLANPSVRYVIASEFYGITENATDDGPSIVYRTVYGAAAEGPDLGARLADYPIDARVHRSELISELAPQPQPKRACIPHEMT